MSENEAVQQESPREDMFLDEEPILQKKGKLSEAEAKEGEALFSEDNVKEVEDTKKEKESLEEEEKEVSRAKEKDEGDGEKEETQKTIKKLEKTAYDNHKFARHQQQKVSDALKLIDTLVEEGNIDEEEAPKLLAILKKEVAELPAEQFLSKAVENPSHPLDKYKNMLSPDVVDVYLEATEDENLALKIRAFDQLIESDATEEEMKQIQERLEGAGKSPISVLKAVLAIGDEQLKEGLGEVYKHRSLKEFYQAERREKRLLKEKLDKALKKLEQYQSTSTAGNWLGSDSGGSQGEKYAETGDMYKDMCSDQSKEKRKR